MKITFYGTAAGEGWPGVFCQCELCREARRLGGKNIRTRSQALVNDDLLIDLPPDNQLHSLYYGLDLSKVRTLLFTHSHSDHCYPYDLEFLREPFSHTYSGRMQVYGNAAVARLVREACGSLGGERERFDYHEVSVNQRFEAGGYTILPLRAVHMEHECCHIYRIAQGDKAMLYAHDTGAFCQESLDRLAAEPGKLALVSMDCTSQKHRDNGGHMGLVNAVEQKEKLLRLGVADENTIWIVNHFSHNGGWLHEEIDAEARRYGFIASYDGMTVEF